MTPLHVAAERGRSHVVKFLAENRASVNIKNCKGVSKFFIYVAIPLLEVGVP